MPWPQNIPTLLKMKFDGGRVVLKFHLQILFFQSYFLNEDMFLVIPCHWQANENYILALGTGGINHVSDCSDCSSTCLGVTSPQKLCCRRHVIILALSSGAKRKYFLTSAKRDQVLTLAYMLPANSTCSAQGSLRNFILQGNLKVPGFPNPKNGPRKIGFATPLYRGRDPRQNPVPGLILDHNVFHFWGARWPKGI